MFNCLFFCQKMDGFPLLRPRPLRMAQDPWGGNDNNNDKKKNEGPPDLDELFGKLIGRRDGRRQETRHDSGDHNDNDGGNRRNGLPNLPFKFTPKNAVIGVGIVLALWMASGIYTVNERENGVETLLGKYSNTSKSGLNWNWPRPLGKVEIVDVQSISTMRVGEFRTQKGSVSTQDQRVGQMLTKDENIVEIGAAVQYRISDARAFQFNAQSPVDVLNDVVTSAIREVVGANTVDDILTDRRNEWPQQARRIIVDTVAAYELGIEVVALELQDARVPVEVQDAFEDAVRAREDEERLRLQAEAFANERLPIARGNAEQIIQSAKAYAARTVARAEAEATRFGELLTAYQKDKKALRSRLYLDTMSSVYGQNRKLVTDGQSTPILNMGAQALPPADVQTVSAIEQHLREETTAAVGEANRSENQQSATTQTPSRARSRSR